MAVQQEKKFEVTVNCVVFGYIEQGMQVCLIKRTKEPYCGSWALPGGYVEDRESLEAAVLRELQYDTGIKKVELQQFHTFDDSENNHINISYYGLVNTQNQSLMTTVKEKNATWFSVRELPMLAFDHKKIITEAFKKMRIDTLNQPIFKYLIGSKFTLTDIQLILEEIYDCKFDKSNFRKRIQAIGLLVKVGKKKTGVRYVEPELYQFIRGPIAKKIGHELFGYTAFIGRLISKRFSKNLFCR